MENEEWGREMENGEWGTEFGEWGMVNGECGMEYGVKKNSLLFIPHSPFPIP